MLVRRLFRGACCGRGERAGESSNSSRVRTREPLEIVKGITGLEFIADNEEMVPLMFVVCSLCGTVTAKGSGKCRLLWPTGLDEISADSSIVFVHERGGKMRVKAKSKVQQSSFCLPLDLMQCIYAEELLEKLD